MVVLIAILALGLIKALMWVVARDDATVGLAAQAERGFVAFEGEPSQARANINDDVRMLLAPAAEQPDVVTHSQQ